MTPERKRHVNYVWHRNDAWKATFEVKLNDVMVGSFFNDDDYDEVRAYLVSTYRPTPPLFGPAGWDYKATRMK